MNRLGLSAIPENLKQTFGQRTITHCFVSLQKVGATLLRRIKRSPTGEFVHPEFPLSKGLSLRENISASEEAGQAWRERIALELELQSNLIHFITLSPLRKFPSLNIKQQEKGGQRGNHLGA